MAQKGHQMPPRTDKTGPDPADMEAVAAERFARDVAAMAQDINYRTHVGHYSQRPDSQPHVGPDDFEALQAALPAGEEIEPDGQGNWVRYVPVVTGQVRDEKGVVYNQIEDTPRFVALTQEAARAASATGRETDWWNGFTWMRRGYKPEKDMLLAPTAAPARPVRLERADAATQALMERDDLRKAANAPIIPRADADAGKKE